MKKAIFSDIDGTLSSGYISLEFLEFLHGKKLFSSIEFEKSLKMAQDYKNGSLSYMGWLDA